MVPNLGRSEDATVGVNVAFVAKKPTESSNFAPRLPQTSPHGFAHGEPRGRHERRSYRGLRIVFPLFIVHRSAFIVSLKTPQFLV